MKYREPPRDGSLNSPQISMCMNANGFEAWDLKTLIRYIGPSSFALETANVSKLSFWSTIFPTYKKFFLIDGE